MPGLPAGVLNCLRPSQRCHLEGHRGPGEHEGGVSVSVHGSANKEKAVPVGRAYTVAEAGATRHQPDFPQYVGQVLAAKMNWSSFQPSLHPPIGFGSGDRGPTEKNYCGSFSLGVQENESPKGKQRGQGDLMTDRWQT